MSKGVMVGCDERQEWLLKWWWKKYEKHNNYPVTFCDFGMNPSARAWCQSKGTLLSELPNSLREVDFTKVDEKAPWIDRIPKYMWDRRAIWMIKPFAFLKTPYEKTLWIDLDCHITGSLSPLFDHPLGNDQFGIAYAEEKEERKGHYMMILKKDVKALQTGVVLFTKDSPLIEAWIDKCKASFSTEFSEKTILSHLIHEGSFDITYLSKNYNWTTPETPNPHALIIHYTDARAKREILSQIKF